MQDNHLEWLIEIAKKLPDNIAKFLRFSNIQLDWKNYPYR